MSMHAIQSFNSILRVFILSIFWIWLVRCIRKGWTIENMHWSKAPLCLLLRILNKSSHLTSALISLNLFASLRALMLSNPPEPRECHLHYSNRLRTESVDLVSPAVACCSCSVCIDGLWLASYERADERCHFRLRIVRGIVQTRDVKPLVEIWLSNQRRR